MLGRKTMDPRFLRDGEATKFEVLRGDASGVVLQRATDWLDLKVDLLAEGSTVLGTRSAHSSDVDGLRGRAEVEA